MRCERTALSGDPGELAARLRASVPSPESLSAAVSEIISRVREEQDAAVLEYTRQLDTGGREPRDLRVSDGELERAEERLDPAVRRGLGRAIENVRRVAEAELSATARRSLRDEREVVAFEGHEVILREVPLAHAAVYVPGGRSPYPSTVVMGVVTARAAGVAEVAVCSPPRLEGEIDPVVLGACSLAGANSVYRMGGAQAITALALGTESVQAADVIVGPGNLWVQEAKLQLSATVGVDGFAGPSDLAVVADPTADPLPLALDLLAQAEHGPGTLVIAVSRSGELLEELGRHIEAARESGAVAWLVEVGEEEEALALAQALSPEHLQLVGPGAEELAPRVTRAGCLFVGIGAATAFGDYIAGCNHVLPTQGAARFESMLSPQHFRRRFAEVRIAEQGARRLAREAAPVARAEGFELHARSMEARIRDNGSR